MDSLRHTGTVCQQQIRWALLQEVDGCATSDQTEVIVVYDPDPRRASSVDISEELDHLPADLRDKLVWGRSYPQIEGIPPAAKTCLYLASTVQWYNLN
eukprot:COSAG05_NODE_6861_length_891_cov_1.782828_2_plen_98_part_00